MLKIKNLFFVLLFAAPVYAEGGHRLGFMDFGGHIQAGLYPNNHGARGVEGNGDLGFMTNPDFNVNQAWVWFAREAQTETDAFDYGFRLEAFYGTDAFFATPFNSVYRRPDGSIKRSWDANLMWRNQLSPGVYGLALPQLYAEISYYKWKLTAGRFLPLIGYEQVDATQNDFYSKTFYTMLVVPSSGTGVMAARSFGRFDFSAAALYGLDNGFENPYKDHFFSGSANYNFSENSYLYYAFISGRYRDNINLGQRIFAPGGTSVSFHNLIFQFKPAGDLRLVTEVYYNHDTQAPADGEPAKNLYGITQYAVYDINEKFSAGLRGEFMEYYHENQNRYGVTANITYKPAKWFYIRPEARYSWGNVPAYNRETDTAQFNFGAEFTAKF